MSEMIFRPDADPETSSIDGYIYTSETAGVTWAAIIEGISGGFASNGSGNFAKINISSDSVSDRWDYLYRSIISFDTSALPPGVLITKAVLSLHGGAGKDDELGIAPDINIYGVTLVDDTDIEPGQVALEAIWDSFGNTAYSNAIAFADWDDTNWNDFTFNVAGRAAISTRGNTRFGIRNANYDVAEVIPAWSNGGVNDDSDISFWMADWSDGSLAPKLTVTYYSGQDTVDQTVIGNKVSLEAIRNLEIVYGGRAYVSKTGNFVYESRYHRNV